MRRIHCGIGRIHEVKTYENTVCFISFAEYTRASRRIHEPAEYTELTTEYTNMMDEYTKFACRIHEFACRIHEIVRRISEDRAE